MKIEDQKSSLTTFCHTATEGGLWGRLAIRLAIVAGGVIGLFAAYALTGMAQFLWEGARQLVGGRPRLSA